MSPGNRPNPIRLDRATTDRPAVLKNRHEPKLVIVMALMVAPDSRAFEIGRFIVRTVIRRCEHAMIATHATMNRVRYCYYVSQLHLRGASTPCGTISRVPTAEL